MSDFARVEFQKSVIAKPEVVQSVQSPTTPSEIHHDAVVKIAGELNQAGHPQTPDQVSAKGGVHTVMAEIEKTNPGVEVLDDLSHRVVRFADNLGRDIQGSTNVYIADDHKKGHEISMGRIGKIVRFAKEPRKILNILRGKKAA